jgi:hypothetical protein
VLSPVNGSFATVALRVFSQDLTPAPRCQDHTSSPSASGAFVKGAICGHRSPPRADDVAQRPSEWDGIATDIEVIWVRRQVEILKNRNIFYQRGLDTPQLEGEQMTN